MIVQGSSYGLIGCEEWRILKSRLELLLSQAEGKGLTSSSAYAVAKRYYDDNSGIFGSPVVLVGSACDNHVNEINSAISGLTAALASSGVAPVVAGPAIEVSKGPWEELGSLTRWLVGGAIAVSAAVMVATVIPRVFGKKRRRYGSPFDPEHRDLEGYRRRSRRRRKK